MVSIKGLFATGFWYQLYKVGHIAYLMRHFLPFTYYCRIAVTQPRVFDFFKALKMEEAATLPVGTAGFCWGGHFVTKLCWDEVKADNGKRLVECGFVAHPSYMKFPDYIDKIVLPYSCAAAEKDHHMTAAIAKQTKEQLAAKTAKMKDHGIEHELVMYEGVEHGFAVRADEDEKHEAEQGKKAEKQAVDWFSRWFANPPPTMAS